MAGVQEYQRVQIESSPAEKVNGAAASDLVHLMTELVDNALAFSPPTAPVKISTKQAGDSTIVEISDGGLGIAQDVLNSLNEDLRSGGEVTVETARRMGLLVVSRLANRHGVTVSLARNARGGTTATVLLPPALLRGRATQVQPKPRPGLAGLTPAKSVLPAAVTEQLSNDREPRKLPTRPQPAAPAAPAAPVAPAAAATLPARSTFAAPDAADATAKAGAPDVQMDSIAAAINAVIRLPQRAAGRDAQRRRHARRARGWLGWIAVPAAQGQRARPTSGPTRPRPPRRPRWTCRNASRPPRPPPSTRSRSRRTLRSFRSRWRPRAPRSRGSGASRFRWPRSPSPPNRVTEAGARPGARSTAALQQVAEAALERRSARSRQRSRPRPAPRWRRPP